MTVPEVSSVGWKKTQSRSTNHEKVKMYTKSREAE